MRVIIRAELDSGQQTITVEGSDLDPPELVAKAFKKVVSELAGEDKQQ